MYVREICMCLSMLVFDSTYMYMVNKDEYSVQSGLQKSAPIVFFNYNFKSC